jgi:uncharacterized protein
MPAVPIEELSLNENPLSSAEMDELGDFLESARLPQNAMTLAALDGFLTAIVVGPAEVPPTEWFPLIWGTPGDQPIFRSPDEENRMRDLVMRFYNSVVVCFSIEDVEFVPLFDEYLRVEGKPYVSADAWCIGFHFGISLRPDAWEPLYEDETQGPLLGSIFWHVDEQVREAIRCWEPDPEIVREEMVRDLVPAVKAINDYWKEWQKRAEQETLTRIEKGLREGFTRLRGDIPPDMLADAVQLGVYHFEAGTIKPPDWTHRMVEILGERAHPWLPRIWYEVIKEVWRRGGSDPELKEGVGELGRVCLGKPEAWDRYLNTYLEDRTPEPRTKSRRVPKGGKSRKGQREKEPNTTQKPVWLELADGTFLKLGPEAFRLPEVAASPQRVAGKPLGPDDPCPCGSGKVLKECCRFVN